MSLFEVAWKRGGGNWQVAGEEWDKAVTHDLRVLCEFLSILKALFLHCASMQN